MEDHPTYHNPRTERTLGALLRIGVIIAGLIVAVGAALFLIGEGTTLIAYGNFRGEPAELRTIGLIVTSAAKLNSRGVIQFGLLFLIGLPIARVIFSVYAFLRLKDWKYVVITMFVLTLLLYSLTFHG
jgi:uncharacterized membrane protein